jgi:hypothetical protein
MDRQTQIANQQMRVIQPIGALLYDVQLSDQNTTIAMTENAACTVTLGATYAQGFQVDVLQFGAGQVTISGDAGASLVSPSGTFTTPSQYATRHCMVLSNPDSKSALWNIT